MQRRVVLPGDSIAPVGEVFAADGAGVHERDGCFCASRYGVLDTVVSAGPQHFVQVLPVRHARGEVARPRRLVPAVGDRVLCQVVRTGRRQALAAILRVEDDDLRGEFYGLIRQQNATVKASTDTPMYELFQPAELLWAHVVALGDRRHLFLSTAEPDTGVVSPGGTLMAR